MWYSPPVVVVGSSAFGVPSWKLVLVTVATAAWSLGVIVDAARGRDDWPVSAFAMYSNRASADAIRDRMFGVADDYEFLLTPGHTNPVAGTRLNFMLRQMRGERGRAGLRAIQKVYELQRQKGYHDDPPLTAIRTERQTWETNRELKGIDRPSRKVTLSVLFPPDELLRALRAEAKSDSAATLGAPHAVGPDDFVFEAEDADLVGSAHRVNDAHASGGAAVEFPEVGAEPIPDGMRSGAALVFHAPRGTYYVWLRLKAVAPAESESLWVSFDGIGEDEMVDAESGIGALPEEYPRGAFAWSGSAEEGPTVNLKRRGRHRLYLMPREGPVVVDQIWLSRVRREIPLFHEPVAP